MKVFLTPPLLQRLLVGKMLYFWLFAQDTDYRLWKAATGGMAVRVTEFMRDDIVRRVILIPKIRRFLFGYFEPSAELWQGGLSWITGNELEVTMEQYDCLLFLIFVGDVVSRNTRFYKNICSLFDME